MKDTIIKGDGTSQFVKAPASMPDTYAEWRSMMLAGTATVDLTLNDDGVTTKGTALSKENLLSDDAAAHLGLTGDDVTLSDAFGAAGATASTVTFTVPVSGWSSDAPYTQSLTVAIKNPEHVLATVALSVDETTAKSEQESWNMVSRVAVTSTGVTLTCYEEKPTVDIPVRIEVLG